MARQIVKESFYIYCNRFKLYIIPGIFALAIIAANLLLSKVLTVPPIIITLAVIVLAEVPCITIFYEKRLPEVISKNGLSLLISILTYCVVLLAMQYAFSFIGHFAGEHLTGNLVTVALRICETILKLLFSFVYIQIIKNGCNIKQSTQNTVKILSANKAWNIALFIKIAITIVIVVTLLLIVFSILLSILTAILSILSQTITTIVVFALCASVVVILIPYMNIVTCSYFESIS